MKFNLMNLIFPLMIAMNSSQQTKHKLLKNLLIDSKETSIPIPTT